MPNWSTDEGSYYWTPPQKAWYESIKIPHAPVSVQKGCKCPFCKRWRGVSIKDRCKQEGELCSS